MLPPRSSFSTYLEALREQRLGSRLKGLGREAAGLREGVAVWDDDFLGWASGRPTVEKNLKTTSRPVRSVITLVKDAASRRLLSGSGPPIHSTLRALAAYSRRVASTMHYYSSDRYVVEWKLSVLGRAAWAAATCRRF